MTSSNIEWTEEVWNPVVGCTPVSEGCRNCYAARMALRLEAMGQKDYAAREIPAIMGTPYDSYTPAKTIHLAQVMGGRPVFTGEVRTLADRLRDPLSWKKPRRVFVNSMSDLFHKDVPFEFIDRVFAVMALTPHITYQILTKRPERMAEYLKWTDIHSPTTPRDRVDAISEVMDTMQGSPKGSHRFIFLPLPNVWLGTSIEDQKTADERIPHLLKCRAAVLWLSYEPALGPIDFSYWSDLHAAEHGTGPWMDWIVMGGESGPGARPMHPAWARSTRDQCAAAGVPFFFKQWGNWGTASFDMTTGEPSFRMFKDRAHWVNKAQTWINGGGCVGVTGKTLHVGGDFTPDQFPVAVLHNVGKKAAGRLLDGVLHDAYPATGRAA